MSTRSPDDSTTTAPTTTVPHDASAEAHDDAAAVVTDPPAPRVAHRASTDVALVATFAAFVAACALVPAIPTGSGVPITLQTFGVVTAGLVLGARRGFLAVALYLAVGLAGVPVFAGMSGGLGVLGGPTVGYLLAFPVAAGVAGWLGGLALRAAPRWRYLLLAAAGLGSSFLVTHPAGILGLVTRLGVTPGEALAIDVVYWPGDVAKNLLAAAVTLAVLRAFPDLRRR